MIHINLCNYLFLPSNLKLVLVFSEMFAQFFWFIWLMINVNPEDFEIQKMHANTCLIFGLTRRQFTAALSTIDFSTIGIEGASINYRYQYFVILDFLKDSLFNKILGIWIAYLEPIWTIWRNHMNRKFGEIFCCFSILTAHLELNWNTSATTWSVIDLRKPITLNVKNQRVHEETDMLFVNQVGKCIQVLCMKTKINHLRFQKYLSRN